MTFAAVDNLFDSLDHGEVTQYKNYWESIKPQTENEAFKRWLFAFMSVHTSWESNVRGYNAIKDWSKWINQPDTLQQILIDSRVGLYRNRTRFVSKFAKDFWNDPQKYTYQGGHWQTWRDGLVKDILGLGMAKVSFSLEMLYPNEAEVACMDTHLFQAYGLNQTKHGKFYRDIENYWLAKCYAGRIPSCIARAIYWDRKQGEVDSRYWSYVLEQV